MIDILTAKLIATLISAVVCVKWMDVTSKEQYSAASGIGWFIFSVLVFWS